MVAERITTPEQLAKYEAIIGLEVHCQLMTNAKIFAGDANAFGAEPNTQVSVITLAHPGTLPKLNRKAVEYAIRMGLACGCTITRYNVFARKNYFYPDLPKGYQLSQDKTPICVGGSITVKLKDTTGKATIEQAVHLHHIHLEEDAGKSIHDEGAFTNLDYNRAGTPLIEMVTEPCIQSGEEAGQFLTEVRKLVRYLDICDGNMEEGSLRCDVNLSIRPKGATYLGTKVEIKNLNSIRNVQRAIDAEFRRQVEAIESGGLITQQTRTFDADKGLTHGMREKETMNDYRYFPDPDLAPFLVSDEWLKVIQADMPALPQAVYQKLTAHYGLPDYDATQLSDARELVSYFETVCAYTTNYKAASNWIMGPVRAHLNDKALREGRFPVAAERLGSLITLIDNGTISQTAGQTLFNLLIEQPDQTATDLAKAHGLEQNRNTEVLQTLVGEVLMNWPDKVAQYRKGKKNLLGLFVGEVMKKSKGSADPKLVNELIISELSKTNG